MGKMSDLDLTLREASVSEPQYNKFKREVQEWIDGTRKLHQLPAVVRRILHQLNITT